MASDIHDHFKNYGPVQVAWVDNATAFISLINKENSSCVIKTIGRVPGFEIKSYADYQTESERMQKKRKTSLTSEQQTSSKHESPPKQKRKNDTFKECNSW